MKENEKSEVRGSQVPAREASASTLILAHGFVVKHPTT